MNKLNRYEKRHWFDALGIPLGSFVTCGWEASPTAASQVDHRQAEALDVASLESHECRTLFESLLHHKRIRQMDAKGKKLERWRRFQDMSDSSSFLRHCVALYSSVAWAKLWQLLATVAWKDMKNHEILRCMTVGLSLNTEFRGMFWSQVQLDPVPTSGCSRPAADFRAYQVPLIQPWSALCWHHFAS